MTKTFPASRRQFLIGTGTLMTGAFLGALPIPSFAAAKMSGFLYSGAHNGEGQFVCRADLARQKVETIPLDFPPHSFCPVPGQESFRVVVIERWGAHVAVANFKEGRLERTITSEPDTHFYGHGVFPADGNVILITQLDYKTGKGHLCGFDIDTGKKVSDFETTPGMLHECHMTGKNTVMVTSTGNRPKSMYVKSTVDGEKVAETSLIELDLNTGKTTERMSIADGDQMLTHYALSENGNLTAITTPRPKAKAPHGEIFVGSLATDKLIKVPLSLKDSSKTTARGEMLSVAINLNGKISSVTQPDDDSFFLIDNEKASVIKQFHADGKIWGTSYDKKTNGFIMNGEKDIYAFSKTAKLEPMDINGTFSFESAHCTFVEA